MVWVSVSVRYTECHISGSSGPGLAHQMNPSRQGNGVWNASQSGTAQTLQAR